MRQNMNMALSFISVLTVLAATFVGAQEISQCVLNCIGQAASANGCDLYVLPLLHTFPPRRCARLRLDDVLSSHGLRPCRTNTECLCTNTKLQQAATSCLQQSCTAQDLQNAESLLDSECASGYQAISPFPGLCSLPCFYLSPRAESRRGSSSHPG